MKSLNVEFLRDYVFSIDKKPFNVKKGEYVSICGKTAELLCKRKICKIKKAKGKTKK